jgi:hypothetical protein
MTDLLALFGILCLMASGAVVFLMLIGGLRFNVSVECGKKPKEEGHPYGGDVFKELS